MDTFEQQVAGVVTDILADYRQGRDIDQMEIFRHPDRDVVVELLEKLRRIIFPGYFGIRIITFTTPSMAFPWSSRT